jgi:hypothetical protein
MLARAKKDGGPAFPSEAPETGAAFRGPFFGAALFLSSISYSSYSN